MDDSDFSANSICWARGGGLADGSPTDHSYGSIAARADGARAAGALGPATATPPDKTKTAIFGSAASVSENVSVAKATPSPTRTPVVAVSLGIAGIACEDFNATVFTLALDSIMENATFSDPTCSAASSGWVLASVGVSVPLVIAAASTGMSVHQVSAL